MRVNFDRVDCSLKAFRFHYIAGLAIVERPTWQADSSIFHNSHTLPQFSLSLFTLQFQPLNGIL
jgi:hypothetical protein